MIWHLLEIYGLGWLVSSPFLIRLRQPTGDPRVGCSENKFQDSDYCLKYHRDGCWKIQAQGRNLEQSIEAAMLGLIWPILAPVAYVYFFSPKTAWERKIEKKRLELSIKELEAENAKYEAEQTKRQQEHERKVRLTAELIDAIKSGKACPDCGINLRTTNRHMSWCYFLKKGIATDVHEIAT